MNYFTPLFGLLLLALGLGMSAQAQHTHHRNCHAMEHLEYLKAQDPQYAQRMAAIEEHTNEFIARSRTQRTEGQVITIPVVVHIIYRTSQENISLAQIQSQIDVLNADFRRLNSDASNTPAEFAGLAADIEVEFALATTDPNGNATNGVTRKSSTRTSWGTNNEMKFASSGGVNAWPTDQYLNMWVCNIGGGILGYAQFPGGAAATDGVVMSPQYFGSSDYGSNFYLSAPFDKGRTTTHEVGHWLNLRHIWGDGGCSVDDFVSDTPTAGAPNYGCPSYPSSSCGSSDMFMNYMDYVNDNCMNMFSQGQKTRMRALFAAGGARASFATSNGGGGTPTYCTSRGNDASYEWIAGVSIGNFSNTSGGASYTDFTAQTVSLEAGQNYSVSLTPGFASSSYNEYWKIWIDFNEDGDFEDAGELVFDAGSLSNTTVNGSLNIPNGTAGTTTRMRVSMKYNGAQTSCESFAYGEVEDYTVSITAAAAPSCGTPSGLFASAITTTTFTLNWGGVTGVSSYDVRLRPSGSTAWIDFTGQSGTSLSLTGASPATTYEYQVRAVCSGTAGSYSASAFVTTAAATVSYCASSANNDAYLWINSFTLGSINNTSGRNGGYANFTNLSTTLQRGSAYSLSIGVGRQGSYRTAYRVWIDYNQDGDFDDAGELIYNRARTTSTNISGSFTVPTTAALGTTRMRVSMKYDASPTPCETFAYGEVEDYTVNITGVSAVAYGLEIDHGQTARAPQIGTGNEDLVYDEIGVMRELVLYPVPTQTVLHVRSDYQTGDLRIYDMLGKVVLERPVSGNSTSVNVQALPAGSYILSITDGEHITRRKFVKQQ